MNLAAGVFSILSCLLFLSAILVFCVQNSVYAALYLISAFVMAAVLFILMGAPFLGFILMIVYIGAVAVFFLFVVMMLDLDALYIKPQNVKRSYFLPISVFFVIFLVELGMAVALLEGGVLQPRPEPLSTERIGQTLYTIYAYPLQGAAVTLFIAMIGAIVLTLRTKSSPYSHSRQNVTEQNLACVGDVLTLVKIEPGQGAKMLYTLENKNEKVHNA